jgi:hypothetical protein
MRHLRAAAENLKAAGCEPEAKHVMDLIGHMEAESRAKSNELANLNLGDRKPLSREGGNSAAMQELRAQMEQMRMEMRQMREELKRVQSDPATGR